MWMRAPIVVMALLTVAACSLPVVNSEADALAKGFYESVRTGADISNDTRLSPDLRGPAVATEVARLRAVVIPNETASRIENRSFNINTSTSGTRVELVHAYHYSDRVVLAETVMNKPPGAPAFLIIGFHLRIEGTPPAAALNAVAQWEASHQPPPAAPTNAPAPEANPAPAPDASSTPAPSPDAAKP